MAKKLCELCQESAQRDMRFGVGLCEECLDCYDKTMSGDADAGARLADSRNYPRATELAKYRIIESAIKRVYGMERVRQEHLKKEQAEIQRQEFAHSFGEYYEYDVVTIVNEGHGRINKEKMLQVLSEHAKQGWKLHTIYSNELGKNAVHLMGLGVNSTACEDVLIFERRIEKIF